MPEVHHGDRIGRRGKIRLGCSAVIFDEKREKVLLTQRADNRLWCLPSGAVDPGERVEETIVREVLEETRLRVRVVRLVGVYSDPNFLVVYPDGNSVQIVALSFEAEVTAGTPGLSDETVAWGYFSPEEIKNLDMLLNHADRIRDAFEQQAQTIIK